MAFLNRMKLCIAAALCMLAGAAALAAGPTEYELKAVFLFNFSQFVDWPQSAFANVQAPLVIGVLGEDPFGAALDEVIAGETVQGRPISVRRFARAEEIDVCHILFINGSARARLVRVLDELRTRPILTVSDAPEFARAGGIIQFLTIDNKVRLQINLDAAKLAQLNISSKLLHPARIVRTD